MKEEKALYDQLLRNAVLLCERSLEGEEASGGEVYVDGTSNILTKPDFVDVDRMRDLFRTFEEKSRTIFDSTSSAYSVPTRLATTYTFFSSRQAGCSKH